jgi:hypothetical protein
MGVQFWQGKVLFVGGQVAMHERCCCGANPCSACEFAQPSAVVTKSGSCTEPECSLHEGTYSFWGFLDTHGSCIWIMKNTNQCEIWIDYVKATGIWNISVSAPTGFGWYRYGLIDADIRCEAGNPPRLVGTNQVPGENLCAGCTATVTLT